MRRLAVLAALAATLLAGALAAGAAGADGGFVYGVAAGEITSTSAILWTRAPKEGRVTLRVECQGKGTAVSALGAGNASKGSDLTLSVPVKGLPAGAACTYRFAQAGAVSPQGRFKTAPAADADVPVRFAVSGDADATPDLAGKPAYNGFQTYARMAAARNDFNINMGDTIYSDSEVADAAVARTVADKREKYKLGLALAPLRELRAATGLYSHWDDHEFINDFSVPEHGKTLYLAGVKAFRDYAPVRWSPATGLYRTVRWGKHLELFFLDQRSFRSAKVAQVCQGDLAPTAPVAVRAAFAALAPPLANPVPVGCLEAITDPARTMLGSAQYAAFTAAIRASTATWKVVLNEVPMIQFYALPYDRWEGYAAERARLLADLVGVPNVVFLTTDMHAHLIGEIRTSTLEPEGPVSSGFWEVVTGPVATNTYAKEIDHTLGSVGTGDFVTSLFLKPSPPGGIGLPCAVTDAFGFAQVTVTKAKLTVAPRTASGKPVRELGGAACQPLVLRAA
ncbi:MAG: hypothetical protein EXQ77_05790 [Thermoleophilia bacterium]|nr:hypothetical protein [Thermoleophilia bacterium]